jgi:hypothetical protein
MANRFLTLSSLAFGSESRRLHTHPATSMTAAMAPAPVAAMAIAAIAVLHLVILAPFPPAIVILPAHCEAADTEDHQQTKYYQFLHKQVSPFRELTWFSNKGPR